MRKRRYHRIDNNGFDNRGMFPVPAKNGGFYRSLGLRQNFCRPYGRRRYYIFVSPENLTFFETRLPSPKIHVNNFTLQFQYSHIILFIAYWGNFDDIFIHSKLSEFGIFSVVLISRNVYRQQCSFITHQTPEIAKCIQIFCESVSFTDVNFVYNSNRIRIVGTKTPVFLAFACIENYPGSIIGGKKNGARYETDKSFVLTRCEITLTVL